MKNARRMKSYTAACTLTLAAVAIPVLGAEFDGSRLLMCANVEAADCAPGQTCVRLRPDDIGAPAFIRIDFNRKVIVGPKRTTDITSIEKADRQLLLQGTELGYAWSIALDTGSGKLAATLADREGVFVLFGNCTAMP
jgi:hypothetical protein